MLPLVFLQVALEKKAATRHDMTEKDGILFKGSQAVVPTALRLSVLESIHDGHLGIMKCLEQAKNSVY